MQKKEVFSVVDSVIDSVLKPKLSVSDWYDQCLVSNGPPLHKSRCSVIKTLATHKHFRSVGYWLKACCSVSIAGEAVQHFHICTLQANTCDPCFSVLFSHCLKRCGVTQCHEYSSYDTSLMYKSSTVHVYITSSDFDTSFKPRRK